MSDHHEACQCEECDRENRRRYRFAALQILADIKGDTDNPPSSNEIVRQELHYLGEALLALAEEVEVLA